MELNETQHKLLNNPNVQMLISALDCEPHDKNELRTEVSKRINTWLNKLQTQKPLPRIIASDRPENKSPEAIKSWTEQMRALYGQQWCPFCISLILGLVIARNEVRKGAEARHPVDHAPVAEWMGKPLSGDPGDSKYYF